MATTDFYEQYWSETGAQYHGRSSPGYERLLAELVTPETACLDVGCGDGAVSGVWLSQHAGSYIGVDVSSRAVEIAGGLGLDARVIGDASSLPFHDATFDLIVCIEVLEHLFEPQLAAREMHRVLRPGGTLVAQVPNVVHWSHRAVFAVKGHFKPYGDALDEPWRDPHIRFFTFRSLQAMLHQQGFQPTRVEGQGGNLLLDTPGLRRFARNDAPGPVSQWLTVRYPAMFARRARVVATKRGLTELSVAREADRRRRN
jgi:methionine biosynthesis protein MetW